MSFRRDKCESKKTRMEQNESIKSVAKHLLGRVNKDVSEVGFYLPIREIDGMKVDVLFKIYTHRKLVSVLIRGTDLYATSDCDEVEYSNHLLYNGDKGDIELEDVEEGLKNLKVLLPKLRFDKCKGVFTADPITNIQDDYIRIFESDNVKLKYEKCAVCLDITETRTKCGHFLCYRCWQDIKRTRCDERECEFDHIKCPICRGDISFTEE